MNTPKHFKRTELFLATCLIAGSFAPVAMAQSAAPAAEVSEILITGSRRSGMAVSDSPAPVQMINAEMLKESGSPDLMNAIATQVPSYNARQTGTDMASQTLTASMRWCWSMASVVTLPPTSAPAPATPRPTFPLFLLLPSSGLKC